MIQSCVSGNGSAEEGGGGPVGQHRLGSVLPGPAETGHQHPTVVSGPRAAHRSQVERHHGDLSTANQDARPLNVLFLLSAHVMNQGLRTLLLALIISALMNRHSACNSPSDTF